MHSLFPLLIQDNSCQTEIANTDMHVVGQKEVTQLQVSVDSLLLVEVRASFNELSHVISDFGLCQSLPSFDKIHEGLEWLCNLILLNVIQPVVRVDRHAF